MAPTQQALKACAEWLSFCLSIGWNRTDLDALEAMWWKYHDDHGQLGKEPLMRSAKHPKVVMTHAGKRQLIHKWSPPSTQITTGILVVWSRDGWYMRVRRDQHKSAESYHRSYWKVVE